MKKLFPMLLFSFVMASAQAEEAPDYKDALTGGWGGYRPALAARGVDVEMEELFDVMGVASGGIDRGVRALDNTSVAVSIDGEKLLGWRGGSAYVNFLSSKGGKPDASLVGSLQFVDGYEVDAASHRFAEFWVQQAFWDNKLSLLAGVYDINAEFNRTETSAWFIGSPYEFGSEVEQSGANGPSTYPYTAPAVRLKFQPAEHWYALAAVFNGTAGSLNHTRGTHVRLRRDDGALAIGEAGYFSGSAKLAAGAWTYTEHFPSHVGGNLARSAGGYIIGQHALTREAKSATRGLDAFLRLGAASGGVNMIDYAWAAGVVYTGFFHGREEGRLGLGISRAHVSDSYRLANGPLDAAETIVELTYSDNLTPWLVAQPDAQYVVNPGADPAIDNALVLGMRFIVNF